MIIVTGATGQLGSRIVEQLLTRIPAEELAVSVRDPNRASSFAERGVRVRSADFTEPAGLGHAFEGADQVLVVSAALHGDEAVRANVAAIDAAREAGARRIVYTSHQAASWTSEFAPQRTHAATEEHLRTVGTPFVALRNGFYTNTIGHFLGDVLQTRALTLPADGRVSWTDHDDLAEAAAIVLTDENIVDGISPPLTAGSAMTFADVAVALSEITGLTIERVVVDDDAWKAAAVDRGMPAQAAEFLLGMFRASRAGEFAVVDPCLESIIGHPPRSAHSVIEAMVGTSGRS